jgi:hypothetical protein
VFLQKTGGTNGLVPPLTISSTPRSRRLDTHTLTEAPGNRVSAVGNCLPQQTHGTPKRSEIKSAPLATADSEALGSRVGAVGNCLPQQTHSTKALQWGTLDVVWRKHSTY